MSKKLLFRNAVWATAALVVNTVLTFVMSPTYVHVLGNQGYGVMEVVGGVTAYLTILEFGTGSAVVRYVADAWAREDREALEQIFNTGLFTLIGAALVSLALFQILILWPDVLLGLDATQVRTYGSAVTMFGFGMAAGTVNGAMAAYLIGMQAFVFINILRIVPPVFQALTLYHILTSGWPQPLYWVAFTAFCFTSLGVVLMASYIVFVDGKVRIRISQYRFAIMKELYVFGSKNTLLIAAEQSMRRLLNIAISHIVGVAQIVYFTVPNRLAETAQSLSLAIAQPMTPYIAALAGRNDRAAVVRDWLQTTRIFQIVTLGGALFTLGIGVQFIRVWMGPEYADRGGLILYILCPALFVQGMASNCLQLLQSMGRHGTLAVYSALLAPIFYLVSIWLGTHWGLDGIAVAVSIFAITKAAMELTFACWSVDLRISTHFRATVLRVIVPLGLTAVTFMAMSRVMNPISYLQLLLYAIPPALVYLAAAWHFSLDAAEREHVRVALRMPARAA